MTMRQLGEIAIKILGVYYATTVVLRLAGAIASLGMPQLAAMNLVGAVSLAVVSGVCLLRAEMLAGWLFSDERAPLSNLARRDCLFLGISLIGVVWAVSGVPEITKAIGKAIWYAEGSRQPMFESMMRASLEGVVNAGLSLLVGVAVILSARRLAARLDPES